MIESATVPVRPDIYLPRPAAITEVRKMTAAETFFRFALMHGERLAYRPGQFIMITVPGIGQMPISITSCPSPDGDTTFDVVIRRVGSVTGAIHRMQPGDVVGVRGPYGTTFPVDTEIKGRDILFICGGIGLVPVRSAIAYVLRHRQAYGNVTILYGTRTPAERLFADELVAWTERKDIHFLETVDRADSSWRGQVGVITNLFPALRVNSERTTAVVCGPPIMYKFVLLELYKLRIMPEHVHLSLERNMKCGIGKCGHCQINHLYACQDGPVIRYADVMDIREAI